MKAGTAVVLGLAGLLLANLVSGCKDPVGPEMTTYESAVFGTFRYIDAYVSPGGEVSFDSTSNVYIRKSDGTYSIRLHGTDKRTRTRQISFDETGLASVERVTFTAAQGGNLGYWKGYIQFEPNAALHRGPWVLPFAVSDYEGGREILRMNGRGVAIPLPHESDSLWLVSWRP